MTQDTIQNIIERISQVNIAVYGDFCLDAYWIMDNTASEISIETGLFTETVGRHYYTPGGAGNVVANLAALKPALIRAIGTIGDDIYGRELASQLRALGADTDSLFVQAENFDTYTYLKRHEEGLEKPRVDFGSYNKRSLETDLRLVDAIEAALIECDALIFNQQVTGSITHESFIAKANDLFAKYADKIVMLDSRHFNERFTNVYRKANDREISSLAGIPVAPGESVPLNDVKIYGKAVFEQTGKPVFATCGDRGIIAFDRSGIYGVHGIQLKGKLDTVGAGDTTISALTLCLAAGLSVEDAARFGNFAAAVTVQKLYTTGTASPEEILAVSADPDYIYNADLATDERGASYLTETEFEICDPEMLERLGHIKHAVFDHDGTISSLRQGWEEIMEPVMMKSILGDQYETIDSATY